jgi:hypothetical protein
MAKLRLEVELSYDAALMHGDDDAGRVWFIETILGTSGQLLLHSNELGDTVGDIVVLRIIG